MTGFRSLSARKRRRVKAEAREKKASNICPCCRRPLLPHPDNYSGLSIPAAAFTLDHIIPAGKGGSNAVENLRPMCSACNKRLPSFLGCIGALAIAISLHTFGEEAYIDSPLLLLNHKRKLRT
jgi:hypothetical protein